MNRRGSPLALVGLVVVAACSRSGLDGELDGDPGLGPGASGLLDAGAASLVVDAALDAGTLAEAGLLREIVLFGGVDPTVYPTANPASCPGAPYADTWTFSAGAWTKREVGGPVARTLHTMTSWGRSVLLYGGISGSACNTAVDSDTWQWDGATWRQLASWGPSSDGVTQVVAMAELGGKVIAYAITNDAAARTNTPSTWEWDGGAWTRDDVASPPEWYGAAMATLGDRVVWQGAGQTWVWDGAQWTRLGVTSPTFTHGYLAQLGAELVLLGDPVLLGDTVASGGVIWDGAAWSPLATSGPTARTNTTIAATSSAVIVFGGSDDPQTAFADTWAWSGGTWTELGGQGPPPRQLAAMATFETSTAP